MERTPQVPWVILYFSTQTLRMETITDVMFNKWAVYVGLPLDWNADAFILGGSPYSSSIFPETTPKISK